MRHRGGGNCCCNILPQRVFPSFSDQLLLLAAITHLLTPSIYCSKCQRCPGFYFSIFLGKDVVSLPSPWPCYSAAPSQTEPPSLLSVPVTYSSSLFLCFLPRSPSPPPPTFSLQELTAEVRGEGCMFASGRGVAKKKKKKEEQRIRSRTDGGLSAHLACLLVVF